jgi:hypothetical protein
MNFNRLALGLLLVNLASAEEIPRAIVASDAPASSKPINSERVVSSTQQFRIDGGDGLTRGTLAVLAEEAKNELLRLTEEKSDPWKIPTTVSLFGKIGDPLPRRTHVLRLQVSEAVLELRLDVHLSRGIEVEPFKAAVTAAMLYDRWLRAQPLGTQNHALKLAPWLIEGLREASDWRLDRSDRRLYEALSKQAGLFKIDELFAIDDAQFTEIDGASRAAFRVSSGALVMALLEQPQGKAGFREFLNDVAGFEGEMPTLLRKHFPELNLSETSLAKLLALELANTGSLKLLTDIMTVAQTETALAEALQLYFRNAQGITQQKNLNAWAELTAIPEPERIAAVRLAQDSLVRLSYRCFPSYRPLLKEYQLRLLELTKNQTTEMTAQLKILDENRATMKAKATRARDYLDWFEITRARETSGVFDDYMRLKERLKSNPSDRRDNLTKYLDRMDGLFNRDPRHAVTLQLR